MVTHLRHNQSLSTRCGMAIGTLDSVTSVRHLVSARITMHTSIQWCPLRAARYDIQ